MKSRPWTAYVLRVLSCALLFVSGYALLAGSTFALRMRNDAPVQTIVVALAGVLSLLPLLFGRRFLGAFLASAFLLSGIGAYWWTTIPWDEFIKDSGFPATTAPRLTDYLLVATPAIIGGFYAVASRASILHADLKNRGADPNEARRAAGASFLAGSALLVLCGALAAGLWALMASGIVFRAVAPMPTGIPALILVGALVTVAYALIARRLPRFRLRKPKAVAAEGVPKKKLWTRVKKSGS